MLTITKIYLNMCNHGPIFYSKQLFVVSQIDHSVNDQIKICKPLADKLSGSCKKVRSII